MLRRDTDLLQEGDNVLPGRDKGKRVTAFYDKVTGRNIYFAATFHDADNHACDNGLTEVGDGTPVDHIAFGYFELDHFGTYFFLLGLGYMYLPFSPVGSSSFTFCFAL